MSPMGYNWADKKMKKKILKIALLTLMVVGIVIPLISHASQKQINEQPPIEKSVDATRCIFGNFIAMEDWETIATLTLEQNCEFYLVNHQTNEDLEGTYTMSNDIKRGTTADLTFYVNGRSVGGATLAWPTGAPMCVYMNGMKFEKY